MVEKFGMSHFNLKLIVDEMTSSNGMYLLIWNTLLNKHIKIYHGQIVL